MRREIVLVGLIFQLLLELDQKTAFAFDMTLDTQRDSKWWKFRGNYVYAHSLADGGRLAPQLKLQRTKSQPTKGVWYYQNAQITEDNDNYFEMSYALRHALFQQVWVRLLAHPSVAIRFKNGRDQEFGAVWSSGNNWCDAILDTKLTNTVRISVNLTEPGTYTLIDRVVLGVFVPISKSKIESENINPCFTEPSKSNSTLSIQQTPRDTREGSNANTKQENNVEAPLSD